MRYLVRHGGAGIFPAPVCSRDGIPCADTLPPQPVAQGGIGTGRAVRRAAQFVLVAEIHVQLGIAPCPTVRRAGGILCTAGDAHPGAVPPGAYRRGSPLFPDHPAGARPPTGSARHPVRSGADPAGSGAFGAREAGGRMPPAVPVRAMPAVAGSAPPVQAAGCRRATVPPPEPPPPGGQRGCPRQRVSGGRRPDPAPGGMRPNPAVPPRAHRSVHHPARWAPESVPVPARRAAPVRQAAPARWAAPVRRAAPARWAAPVRRAAPARQVAPVRRATPARWARVQAPAPASAPRGRRSPSIRSATGKAAPAGGNPTRPARHPAPGRRLAARPAAPSAASAAVPSRFPGSV